jgi:hypothetical protein
LRDQTERADDQDNEKARDEPRHELLPIGPALSRMPGSNRCNCSIKS